MSIRDDNDDDDFSHTYTYIEWQRTKVAETHRASIDYYHLSVMTCVATPMFMHIYISYMFSYVHFALWLRGSVYIYVCVCVYRNYVRFTAVYGDGDGRIRVDANLEHMNSRRALIMVYTSSKERI